MPISNKTPKELEGVKVQEKLGTSISKDLTFLNQNNQKKSLRDYLALRKPILLTLNYYKCPQLCSLMLNGLVSGLKELREDEFSKFQLVTLSINHREGTDLAKNKREIYLQSLNKKKVAWDFLVGKKKEIETLSKELGFRFNYVKEAKEYAHPAVIFVLTPQGKLSQYLYGIRYKVRDLRFSLLTASDGQIGNVFTRVFMSCFVYNSKDGKYSIYALGIVRLGGFLSIFIMGLFLTVFWMKEWTHQTIVS